jgi:hypothetical protein
MAPAVTPSDMYEGMGYQGGAKVLHDLRWVAQAIIPDEIRRRVARGEEAPASGTLLDLDTVLAELPLGSHPLIQDVAAFYLAAAETDRQVVERVAEIAEKQGVPRVHIALAWLLQKQPITAPIIGATKITHGTRQHHASLQGVRESS